MLSKSLILCILIGFALSKPQDPSLRSYDRKHNEPLVGLDELTEGHGSPMNRKDGEKLLAILADKMDVDRDGFISEDEMRKWLKSVASKYVAQDVDKTFDEYTTEFKTGHITFDHHKMKISDDFDEDEAEDRELQKTIERDQRRFEKADIDHDGKLTKDEFAGFLHPEEFDYMRDIVIDETIEDLDMNNDGLIDLDEYTKDMWSDDSGPVPEWVKTEQQQFRETRDRNGDGFLDREEVRAWLFPADYDHIESELRHLMAEADDNKDGKLSKDEILSHYHVFVGSQATDFGQALYTHDEL